MLLDPRQFAPKGWIYSSDKENPLDLREDGKGQVQQAGFDVRVAKIFQLSGTACLRVSSKELPSYQEVLPNHQNEVLLVPNGAKAYAVECYEHASLPVGYEGKLIHRSTLNRSGCFLTGSVYDPGFKGVIGGTLYVFNPIWIQIGARIGQFQIQTAEHGTSYAGDFQNLTTHEQGAKAVKKESIKDNKNGRT